MRALCEACGKPQPPDWSPGEQCVHCGQAVRREVRCFWCAKWTPAAKFCRGCGAETVDPRLYGAARMLKDAGTDRFSVPKQLRDFDPEQIENFSRIYQRHATAVARHVDELRFLERRLRQKHWSGALEDQLVPQLPWPEETLEKMSAPPTPAADELPTAQAIAERSPFPTTRALAALVRLRLDDWGAYKAAAAVFHSGDPALKAEAALVLTSWRVLSAVGRPRENAREIYQELEKSPFKLEAAVRRGQLGQADPDLLREALASPDAETSFAAALVLGDVDRLQAALKGPELEKVSAGHRLVSLGVIKPVVEVVSKSPLEVQRELVDALVNRKGPAPEAADTLLEVVETTDDDRLRERAARVLCRQLRPEWVLRIARAAKGDRSIHQSLLQAEHLTPEAAVELGDFLLKGGHFSMHAYGVSTAAEKGRMPFTWVPARFAAADAKAQEELLRFAEVQLAHGGDERLHDFLLTVVFGAHPAKVRAAAWWCLSRGYRSRGDHRGEGPFKLEEPQIARVFGSLGAFLPLLAAVLSDRDTLKEVGYYEMIANLLGTADDATVEAMQADEGGGGELLDALLKGMKGDYWPYTLEAMITLAARLGDHDPWRAKTLEALRRLGKKGNYHYDKALRRLELAVHGIPPEDAWNGVDPAFVPERWADAMAEGRAELLKLADHLLVHCKEAAEPVLLPFLLEAALEPGDAELRQTAAERHDDRARRPYAGFPLRRVAVEEGFGNYPRFVAIVARALKDPGPAEDLLGPLFSDPKPDDAAELAAAGDAGQALITAMLARAGAKGNDRLRHLLVMHLATSGAHKAWRKQVVSELERFQGDQRFDLAQEAQLALQALKPPPKPKAAPKKKTKAADEEEEPAVELPAPDDWAGKQKIVEKLAAELQAAMFRIMASPASPEEKTREAQRLTQEYQARIKELYG